MPEHCTCRDCMESERYLQEAQRAIEQARDSEEDADSLAIDAMGYLEAYLDAAENSGDQ